MDLPHEKGTYVLIASVARIKRLAIGQLGEFDIVPGFYAYVGSAFGAGGLRARIGHHLESTASLHWHIDFLLQVAEPVEVWYTIAGQKLEHSGPSSWSRRRSFEFRFPVLVPRITTAVVRAICFTPSDGPPLPGFANSCWRNSREFARSDL